MTGPSEAVGGEVDDDYVLDPKGIAILGDPIVGVEVVTLDERGPGALAARALASPNEPTPADLRRYLTLVRLKLTRTVRRLSARLFQSARGRCFLRN